MGKKTLLFLLLVGLCGIQGFSQQSPDQFFSKKIGSDKTLIIYPDIIRYFKYLDRESKKIKLIEEGVSTLNNPIYLAAISSEKNITDLDRLKSINQKLANPDTITDKQAITLIQQGKVFLLLSAGIHATEIGATQMAMLLAHKLATSSDPRLKSLLDDVVLLLMPSINPDGNIMVTQWYNKYLGTPFEGCRMPYLYHHYAGHDNNRDFYMLNLKETRIVNRILHQRYFPQVYLDMHQMGSTGPRMFVPPYKDPLNKNLHPMIIRESDVIGTFMSLKLQESNKKGVASGYTFDAYWPGGTKNTAWYKHVVGILTEMASVKVATPIYVEANELRVSGKGLPEYKRQVNFPDPWPGGWWHLKDIIDYELIAAEALLEVASLNRYSFLNNFYQMGLSSLSLADGSPVSAFIVPQHQKDLYNLNQFLERMLEHGVRIFQLTESIKAGHLEIDSGSFIFPLNQPYSRFVKVMMEKQHYPEIRHMSRGPIIEPYDSAGWTLPQLMGIESYTVNIPVNYMAKKMKLVKSLTPKSHKIKGTGPYICIPARFTGSARMVNRLLKQGKSLARIGSGSFSHRSATQLGDFVLKNDDINKDQLDAMVAEVGIPVLRTNVKEKGSLIPLRPVRLGIYQSYRASMDEGWTRWVLDHFEFPYKILHNQDFKNKKGLYNLNVIIFPDMGRNTILNGTGSRYYSRRSSPMPAKFVGGIGKKGIQHLKEFVKKGGNIILLDSAAELAIEDFKLPLRNLMKGIGRDKFYCPGSILKIRLDPMDPIAWGMGAESILFFRHSMAFQTGVPTSPNVNRKVVASFNEREPHLVSGYIKGEKLLNRTPIIVRYKYYRGNIIVLGGHVQHRSQTFATFKLLFNSIYFAGLQPRPMQFWKSGFAMQTAEKGE